MATRCNIILSEKGDFPFSQMMNWEENGDYLYYKHWDGYPDNMVPLLKEVCDYCAWDKETIDINLPEDIKIEEEISGDIDYLYLIDCDDKTIKYLTYKIV